MNIETQTSSIEQNKSKSTIKQRVRLMEYLNTRDIGVMYEAVDSSPENHDGLFNELIDKYPLGKINENIIKPFLQEIDPPMSQARGREGLHETVRGSLFQEFSHDDKKMDIVEFLSRNEFDPNYPVDELELEKILIKYPTPIDAREKIDEFFGDFLYKQNEGIIQSYQNTAEDFLKKFYGKRYEYSKCFYELQDEIYIESQKLDYAQELTPEISNYSTSSPEQNKDGYFDKKISKMILDRFKILK